MGKILVIDDEVEIQKLLVKILAKNGHEVLTEGNGKRASEIVREKKPDIVLLDLKLPGVDGHKVLKKIRHVNKTIGIIVITGYGNPKSVKESRRLGVSDYIPKPFSIGKIREVVEHALKVKKKRELKKSSRKQVKFKKAKSKKKR